MTEIILDTQILPEKISPKEEPSFDHLIGMFSDGKISIDDFLAEKQKDKELEKEK